MEKRPLKVFLCHASTDKPKVRELYRYLKKRGIQPWFDEEDLVGGQDWQVEIPKALATSDAIIICLTKNSVDKEGYIQKEIKFALDKALEMPEGRIFLIPVKFEECEVPFTLSRYQWVDLTIESGYAKMMKALKFRASQLERSTVELTKKDVEEENLAREKKEREAVELAEQERKAKELREKQVREFKEKISRTVAKNEDEPVAVKPKLGGQIFYWFGGFIVVVLGIIFISSLNNPPSTPQPTPENTQTQEMLILAQDNVEPSAISKSISTPVSTFTPIPLPTENFTPTPLLEVGSTQVSDKDEMVMVYVPEGIFTMGTDYGYSYEQPAHKVFLDSFWIDKTEVSNSQYANCVSAGYCVMPLWNGGYNPHYYSENKNADFPIVKVNWNDANSYCEWVGRRLPTEAEWEKAARGTDGRLYPWGEESPSCDFANIPNCGIKFSGNIFDLSSVYNYADSASPYGALNMIGNAWEWVADWYDETYYSDSPSSNPKGPSSGLFKLIRGGSIDQSASAVYRTWAGPDSYSSAVYMSGFRCAKDVIP